MGDLCVDGPNSPPVKSWKEMIGRFQGELYSAVPGRQARLTTHPEQLEELERDVQAVFDRGAGLLVAGLLAVAMKTPAFDGACEETRRNFAYPLATGRMRQIRVRLLSGLLVRASSLYCAPRKSWLGRTEAQAPGAYVELAQFGFGKGRSPGLQSKVARQADGRGFAAICGKPSPRKKPRTRMACRARTAWADPRRSQKRPSTRTGGSRSC
jgi:hypothetical protein